MLDDEIHAPRFPGLDPGSLEAKIIEHKAAICGACTPRAMKEHVAWLFKNLPRKDAELEIRRIRGGLAPEVKAWLDMTLETCT